MNNIFFGRPAHHAFHKPLTARLSRRYLSSWSSSRSWAGSLSNDRLQAFISKTDDPHLNLAIEYYIFQKSAPGSRILFLYQNRPCIVIGRNQNPWLEVNLSLLKPNASSALGKVDLIRRRSGGGTVFHDEGNLNWSVICDMPEFTRDKHAEMVVRALRRLGIARSRVNKRHDIVLDQGSEANPVDTNDTHRTPWTLENGDTCLRPLKVSGSAYKLARNRALHHGTALLDSPNLNAIPHYLRSPAKRLISAKGVESVSSPVSNIGIERNGFEDAVLYEFQQTYGGDAACFTIEDGPMALDIDEVRKDYEELKSLDWTYLQTPQFQFTWHPFSMTARHGVITRCGWEGANAEEAGAFLNECLSGRTLHQIADWQSSLKKRELLVDGLGPEQKPTNLGEILSSVFVH
jgi:lipoate---protein ligase